MRGTAMKRFGMGLALALLGAPAIAATPAETAATLRDQALGSDWSYKFLESLTTEIGQRLAGTPAHAHAVEWAQAKLKAAGFENVHTEPFPLTAWIRGAENAAVTAPTAQHLVITTLGGSVATPPAGIDAEIALFRSYAELLAAPPGSLTGKIAVVTQHMARVEDGSGYGAANPIRRAGPSEAAKRGAVAYLLRSLGTDNHRLAHTGALNYADGVPKIPAAALSNQDADQLERLAALGPVKLHLLLSPTENKDAKSWNVVGEVQGSTKPDEVVLIGAHLDSWDLATGATDDGAGDAIVTGAARLIEALPVHPRRTIRVVLFGAEEMDWSGAAYAKAHADETAKIVLAEESDFGSGAAYTVLLPPGAGKTALGTTLNDVLAPLSTFVGRDPAMFGGDDIHEIHAAGVPILSVRQNGLTYFDTHHTADDTFDKIDPKDLAQNVAVLASAIYLAADSDLDFRKLPQ